MCKTFLQHIHIVGSASDTPRPGLLTPSISVLRRGTMQLESIMAKDRHYTETYISNQQLV